MCEAGRVVQVSDVCERASRCHAGCGGQPLPIRSDQARQGHSLTHRSHPPMSVHIQSNHGGLMGGTPVESCNCPWPPGTAGAEQGSPGRGVAPTRGGRFRQRPGGQGVPQWMGGARQGPHAKGRAESRPTVGSTALLGGSDPLILSPNPHVCCVHVGMAHPREQPSTPKAVIELGVHR